jgi:hypothetical protein
MRIYNIGKPTEVAVFDWNGHTYIVNPIGARYRKVQGERKLGDDISGALKLGVVTGYEMIPGSEENETNWVNLPAAAKKAISKGSIKARFGKILRTEDDMRGQIDDDLKAKRAELERLDRAIREQRGVEADARRAAQEARTLVPAAPAPVAGAKPLFGAAAKAAAKRAQQPAEPPEPASPPPPVDPQLPGDPETPNLG